MDQMTFDDLARFFATTRSRRDVLKRLIAGAAGGAVVATGFTRSIEPAAAQQCTPDDGSCTADADCCSGSCDDSGACSTPDTTCIEDGGLCQAGLYCCSGLDCAPGGHCPSSTVSTLPDTGAGSGGSSDSISSLIMPVAALGAAAVVGARRIRSTTPDDTNA
jgi:hypothetical protein